MIGERVWKLKSTLNGHLDAVRDVHFLNSNILISVSEDCMIKLWNINGIDKGKNKPIEPISTLRDHSGPIFCCEAEPGDTGVFFTGGNDGIVRIWSMQENITNSSKSKDSMAPPRIDKEFFFRGNFENLWELAAHPREKML